MTPIYFSMLQDSFFDNRLEVIPLSWRPVPHICLQSSKLALLKSNTFLCVEVASSCPHPCPEFLISTFTLTFLVWSLESCFHNSLYIFKSSIVELQIHFLQHHFWLGVTLCQVLVQDPGGNVPRDRGQLSGNLRCQLQPQHAAAPMADLLLHR